jgi:hypothetical protein
MKRPRENWRLAAMAQRDKSLTGETCRDILFLRIYYGMNSEKIEMQAFLDASH